MDCVVQMAAPNKVFRMKVNIRSYETRVSVEYNLINNRLEIFLYFFIDTILLFSNWIYHRVSRHVINCQLQSEKWWSKLDGWNWRSNRRKMCRIDVDLIILTGYERCIPFLKNLSSLVFFYITFLLPVFTRAILYYLILSIT